MNKTLTLPRDTSMETVTAERRQEGRLQSNIPGEIKVVDKAGRTVTGEITIEDWSDAGCRFEAGIPLKAGDIVAIKPLETAKDDLQDQQPLLFEIAWTNRRVAFWVAGAIKLQGEKLATAKLPLANYISRRPSK
jgi:hypothetical protein